MVNFFILIKTSAELKLLVTLQNAVSDHTQNLRVVYVSQSEILQPILTGPEHKIFLKIYINYMIYTFSSKGFPLLNIFVNVRFPAMTRICGNVLTAVTCVQN